MRKNNAFEQNTRLFSAVGILASLRLHITCLSAVGITNSHLFHSRIANSAEHKRVSVVSPALSGRDSSDSYIINGIYTEYDWLLFIVFVLSAFKYKRRKRVFFRKKS